MNKRRNDSDTISEEEFTVEMSSPSTSPEDDSPGDSESDAGFEFAMGLNFDPLDKNQNDFSSFTPTSNGKGRARTEDDIPETARVISSDMPEPSLDLGEPSDTH